MSEDQVFIRADLPEVGGVTTAYRLDKGLHDFLNKVLEKHGKIEAITLELDERGYGWNIGFLIPKPKAEKELPHQEGEAINHPPVVSA